MGDIKHNEYDSECESAADVSTHINHIIWGYFLVFGIFLFVMVGAFVVYFRFEVEREHYQKVGMVESRELKTLRQYEDMVLRGAAAITEGKKNISIRNAMEMYLQKQRSN